MTDHITPQQPGTPALDYEAVKDFFFEKLAADRHGRGRMESAQYHTVQWVFLQGCHERDKLLARIAELESSNAVLLNNAADAHERIADLVGGLGQIKKTLEIENCAGGAINDTIWHTPHETMFDFITSLESASDNEARHA